jgi:hypothetical protein
MHQHLVATALWNHRNAAGKGDDGVSAVIIGEMQSELTTAQIALESMIASVNDLNVEPGVEHANRALIRKTIVAELFARECRNSRPHCFRARSIGQQSGQEDAIPVVLVTPPETQAYIA